ncbi:MAG: FAD-dependent oxidoreductase [Actinobacteria bacterium]|nr:FAD-dependent oxidoreductase [Actinomycetota bacterium]
MAIYDVIIIGSGPAGLTAGLYVSRAGFKTLIIAGVKWGGQLQLTTQVENFPGFPEGIQGPDLMVNMKDQTKRFGTEIIDSLCESIDFKSKPFAVKANSQNYQGKVLILATGADTKWTNIPGEQEFIGRGVSSCAPCDAFFYKNKKVIVIGGGDSAMEEAFVLSKFATEVFIVHRRDRFRASYVMQERIRKTKNIHLIFNAQVIEITGKGKVESAKIKILSANIKQLKKNIPHMTNLKEADNKGSGNIIGEMSIDGVFVAIGHTPNTGIFKEIEKDSFGYLKRKEKYDYKGKLEYSSLTNISGVFTAGDVHDSRYQQAITAAGFGCMAALDAVKWIEENNPIK